MEKLYSRDNPMGSDCFPRSAWRLLRDSLWFSEVRSKGAFRLTVVTLGKPLGPWDLDIAPWGVAGSQLDILSPVSAGNSLEILLNLDSGNVVAQFLDCPVGHLEHA